MRTDRRTGGRTDMMKLIVDFRNFANARNNIAEMFMPLLINTLE